MIVGDAIGPIHDSVKEGESVVTPMSSSKLFPPMVISMVDVGEETGQLPDMLLKVADVYDDEVDNAVGAMTSMLEPITIVFLAVVVGGIVFAMFLPPLLQVIERWVNPLRKTQMKIRTSYSRLRAARASPSWKSWWSWSSSWCLPH